VDDDREERRTRFTNYSMSSAVIKRPDGLQTIDEHFEALYEQYDEEKLGEGDEEELGEIAGFIEQDSERVLQLVEEHSGLKRKFIPEKPSEEIKQTVLIAFEKEEDCVDDDMEDEDNDGSKKPKWDCESVLSTYSNLYNHPAVIKEAPSKKRKAQLAKAALEQMDDDSDSSEVSHSVISGKSTSTVRPKGETAEERRIRKQAVKQERRERRAEKKANQFAFKERKKEEDLQRLYSLVKARSIK